MHQIHPLFSVMFILFATILYPIVSLQLLVLLKLSSFPWWELRSHKKAHFIFSRVVPISTNPGAISPPGFAKTVGRRGAVEWPEWRLVVGRITSHVSVSPTDYHRQHQTPSASPVTTHRQEISDKLFPNCLFSYFLFDKNPMFYSLPGWLMELAYHIISCDRE